MATIFEHFYEEPKAFINPCDVTDPVDHFPEVCITTFSEGIIDAYAKHHDTKVIAHLYSANGTLPVYEIEYEGKKMGLFLSRVGAPACVSGLEEIISLGAKKIVQFGCCGVLNEALVDHKIILPSSAIRDEGTSYHYLPASEEIQAQHASLALAEQCFKKHQIPYVVGKIWTTDAIYRETRALVEERKKQGCLGVEMECSASLAVAEFRKISIIQFLYGADSLDHDQWDIRDLDDYGTSSQEQYMTIALQCAAAF